MPQGNADVSVSGNRRPTTSAEITTAPTALDYPDCRACQMWQDAGASWPRPCKAHYGGESAAAEQQAQKACPTCDGRGGTADGQPCSDCLATGCLPACRCGESDCPSCGDPRAYVEDMALREEMAAWTEDDSPQAVTYQEAILEGADPTEGFYDA